MWCARVLHPLTMARTGTYNSEFPLVCNRKTGCYFHDRRQKTDVQLRTLYKTNGGAIQEAANGHMWVESNVDGGDWCVSCGGAMLRWLTFVLRDRLYRFGVMMENKKEIVLLDHSRDLWIKVSHTHLRCRVCAFPHAAVLQIKPPPAPRGMPYITARSMLGQQKDANRHSAEFRCDRGCVSLVSCLLI